jgi:thiol-disulfide isomerase/thioredoxin
LDNLQYLKFHNYYASGEWEFLPMEALPNSFRDSLLFGSAYNFSSTYAELLTEYTEYSYDFSTRGIADSIRYAFPLKSYFRKLQTEMQGADPSIALGNYALSLSFEMRNIAQDEFFHLLDSIDAYLRTTPYHYQYYAFKKSSEALKRIAIGSEAPNITLLDKDDRPVSLSDYRGRMVYINFWGTWCGPCVGSIPEQIELHKQYVGKDIVFLNIAMESDSAAVVKWKKLIEEKAFTGDHLVALGQVHNDQLVPYMISSAPTYMIIGRQGEIIETRAKPAYMNKEQIDALLGE